MKYETRKALKELKNNSVALGFAGILALGGVTLCAKISLKILEGREKKISIQSTVEEIDKRNMGGHYMPPPHMVEPDRKSFGHYMPPPHDVNWSYLVKRKNNY